jgi:oxygen-independent coproporphyrinogen III oxidase
MHGIHKKDAGPQGLSRLGGDVDVGIDVSGGALRPGDPLGVYVHFPFCSVRCPYCDFAVDTRAEIPHDAYADAVVAEVAARGRWFDDAGPLVSIYFGGGTPGLWRSDALGRVIAAARGTFGSPPAADLEITVEVNPGETDAAHLRALRGQGVNRLSIGIQALEDRLLVALGRNHDAAAGPAAVVAARAAGFDDVSIDLIFGVPGQSLDDWRRAVEAALTLAPTHVSAYALTIERGTVFGARERAGQLPRPDDEAVAAMFEHARAAFAAAGLPPYEVSSYARPGRRARHNQLYWSLGPYLGAGASAASFRPLAEGGGWRFSNPRATDVYLKAAGTGGGSPAARHVERRTTRDLENEAVWLGLRTIDGIDRAAHHARHGRDPLTGREPAVAWAVAAGWLVVDAARVRLTPAGVLFADEIAGRLWRDEP